MKHYLFIFMTMIAGSASAASLEKAEEYTQKILEINDMNNLADATAEAAINNMAQAGLSFSGENRQEAIAIMSDVLAAEFPKIFDAQIPLISEVYTDEELDALMEFMSTDLGASASAKGGIFGAKSTSITQEIIMPSMIAVMPKIMPLADQ